MSTPSKKRRQAREWMRKAADSYEKKGVARGFREGAARMRDDMMRLLPDPDGRSYDDNGQPHVRQMIRRFPDPYENGPYYRVPMPAGGIQDFRMFAGTRSEMMRTIDFRPVQHAITTSGPGGRATLGWFTWEPTSGSEELGERTAGLFHGLRKLSRVSSYLDWMSMTDRTGVVIEARDLLRDATEELRRRLGKFAVAGPSESKVDP